MRLYCRECCKFVSGRLVRCRSCGHQHTREHPALEEPIRKRRRSTNARRGSWEFFLFGGR
jgi:hypothetical protein